MRTAGDADAIIIGAGPAGLACAQSLGAIGLKALVLEKADNVGAVWRRHYDRLHLHTGRNHSGLPGMAMPLAYPTYPSRAEVLAYLEDYTARFDIRPVFGAEVAQVSREGGLWRAQGERIWSAPTLVVATGIADFPHRPSWPGIGAFDGDIRHSSAYRNPSSYAGKRVLVVGFGNSGGEIALDLANANVDVALAVRGPVQILPRDLLGLPITAWAIFYGRWPARLVDFINAPILRLAIGPIEPFGLRRAAKGPRRMVEEDGRAPVIDIGALARIRDGKIKLRGGIDRLTPDGVVFADSIAERFDAIILATGFRPDLRPLVPDIEGLFDHHGRPLVTGRTTSQPGFFFCGQTTSPTGQLREIGIEAGQIAALARRHVAVAGAAAGASPSSRGSSFLQRLR
jgi:cation diffusion facilitator CzcD-associated flavoprotein CzcO